MTRNPGASPLITPFAAQSPTLAPSRQRTACLPPSGEAVTDHNPVTESQDGRRIPDQRKSRRGVCTAILALNDWKRGDPEPQVSLDGKVSSCQRGCQFRIDIQ